MASSPASDGGKTVLITGAAHRIGRAIALNFAGRGWQVAVHYHSSQEAAEALVADIAAQGSKAAHFAADLTDSAAARALIPRCVEALGAPVCLINNASLFQKDDLATLTDASWQSHIDINLRAPVLLAQSLARHLPAGSAGHIINIIDQCVLKPSPAFFSYAASKAGLWWVTKTMAQALAPAIRVNAVAPGPVLPSIHQTAEDFAAEQRSTLLQHGPQPEEIAAAVQFLRETPSITGEMICIDGGQHLTWD